VSKDNKAKVVRGPWSHRWWTDERRAAASAAWTPERRAAMSDLKKAHPTGNRSKEWWAAHPEARAANSERMRAKVAAWIAAEKAAAEAGG